MRGHVLRFVLVAVVAAAIGLAPPAALAFSGSGGSGGFSGNSGGGWSGGGWSGGYSGGGYSGGGYSGGYSGYGTSGTFGGFGQSGIPGGAPGGVGGGGASYSSPYGGSAPYYAGNDTFSFQVGGQTVSGSNAAEWSSTLGASGYGTGGTFTAIPSSDFTGSQLSSLEGAGFQTVSTSGGTYVVASPAAYGGTLPGGYGVQYNGGETQLYGGNGSVSYTGGTTGGGTSGGGGGGCQVCYFTPQGPTAGFTISPSPSWDGEPVTFDAASSQPGSGTITSYSWTSAGPGGTTQGSGETWSPTFEQTGAYSITLSVTNSYGLSASSSQTLTVQGITVAASFNPGTMQQGQTANLQATTSGPVRQVTVTLPWNGQTVSLTASGSSWSASIPTAGVTPDTYQMPVIATSRYGEQERATAMLVVVYPPPVLGNLGGTCPTVQGQPAGTAYFGETCTVTVPVSGGPVSGATASFDWTNIDVFNDVPQPPQTVDLTCSGGTCSGTWKVAAYPYTEDAPFAQDEQNVPVSVTVTATGSGGSASASTTLVVDGTIYYPVPVSGRP